MLSEPRVSVIIPTYNSSQWLSQAIESVLAQADYEIEIFVVDDGSTDCSREIAASYHGVHLLEQSHQGACRARNFGLQNCTGEFVKFLDADDFLEPGVISRQLIESVGKEERTIVYSDIKKFDNFSGESKIEAVIFRPNEDQIHQILKKNIPTPAPLHRRNTLLRVGGFDERLLREQEYNLHLRLVLSGSIFHHLPGVGVHVREHDSPDRISNQVKDSVGEENAFLRSSIYFNLLRERFGSSVPSPIRQHFFSIALEAALVDLRRKKLDSARRRMSYALQYEPSLRDILIGGVDGMSKVIRSQIRKRFSVQRSGAQ